MYSSPSLHSHYLLAALADAAGRFGIWLALIILPAFFRYELYLLDARANGRAAPVPGIEEFSLVDNFWAVFPAVLLCMFIWFEWYNVINYSMATAKWMLIVFLFVYPASMVVLGVTHSPVASINPLAIWRMVRVCGRDYFWFPAVMVPVVFAVAWISRFDTPFLVLDTVSNFAFVLLFTLTGAVLRANDVIREVDIELPPEQTVAQLAEDLVSERQRVANHAYGFISRGNRAGGFAHIRQWLEQETHRDEAYQWFFQQMLTWENTVPALFFAHEFLNLLLKWNMDREALKLIARCLHEDPRWRPGQEGRDAVQELLQRHGREDLVILR